MQILHKKLPTIWPLQVGECPTPAAEAAAALLELTTDAQADAQAMLAQLGAAPDATPAAITTALQLQELLAEVVELAVET
jgi:hypothetical protein